jgi:hypothetical protein
LENSPSPKKIHPLDKSGSSIEGKSKFLLSCLSQKQPYSIAYSKDPQGFKELIFVYLFFPRGTSRGSDGRIRWGSWKGWASEQAQSCESEPEGEEFDLPADPVVDSLND